MEVVMTVAPKRGESHSIPVDRRTDAQWIGGKPSGLIFDVNETLIDVESMNPLFKRVFGDERVLREWFGHLIMYSMALTLSGLYKDYFSLGQGLFEMVGAIHKVKPAYVEALTKRTPTPLTARAFTGSNAGAGSNLLRSPRQARTRRCSLRAAVGHTCVSSWRTVRRGGHIDQRIRQHVQCHATRPRLWCRYTFVTLDP
jgi:hypothetical protein